MEYNKRRETTDKNLVAKEGIAFIAIGLITTAVLYYYLEVWAAIPLVITFFMAFFFRNPDREVPECDGIVVSPADGRVIRIDQVVEEQFLNGNALRVTIFMSLFNVHVNRIPVSGKVEHVYKRSGDYIPAYKPQAPERNVACYTLINTRWGNILVAQITGAVARRLVCYAYPGKEFITGQIFGLIRFGSCVQLYLPPTTELYVEIGEKVRGGETEIGRLGW